MSQFDPFIRVVTNMMNMFGTDATVVIGGDGVYDATTSEFVKTDTKYNVRAIFMDLMKHTSGDRTKPNSLIEEGDRQIFIQPPRGDGTRKLPALKANKDTLEINGAVFKLVYVKQLNTTTQDCILYDCYCRD